MKGILSVLVEKIKDFIFIKRNKNNILFLKDIRSFGLEKDTLFECKLENSSIVYRLSNIINYDSLIINLDIFRKIKNSMKKSRRKASTPLYWRVIFNEDSIQCESSRYLNKLYIDNTDDKLVFYIDNRTYSFTKFIEWIDNMYYNKSNRDLYYKFHNHLMNDIGVDLFAETVEISSEDIFNDFKIKIDKLQLATKNIELDSDFYIIRKVFNKFYIITELNRLYTIEDEENDDFIICTKSQLEDNIIPPAELFVAA